MFREVLAATLLLGGLLGTVTTRWVMRPAEILTDPCDNNGGHNCHVGIDIAQPAGCGGYATFIVDPTGWGAVNGQCWCNPGCVQKQNLNCKADIVVTVGSNAAGTSARYGAQCADGPLGTISESVGWNWADCGIPQGSFDVEIHKVKCGDGNDLKCTVTITYGCEDCQGTCPT
jgi:hypothetical protein